MKWKLTPCYIGPFQILEWIGMVVYRLTLPLTLVGVHNIFHVSILQKYLPDATHILKDVLVSLHPYVTYEEFLVYVLDHKECQLWNKTIRLVKVD